MRDQISVVAFLAAIGASVPAMAAEPRDSGVTSPLESLPQSIWTVDENSVAHHVQTGLSCPYAVGTFTLAQVMNFDPVGLDVACNYNRPEGGAVTVHLTKRNGQRLEDDIARVHSEIALTHADWPMADAAQTRCLPRRRSFCPRFIPYRS